MLFEVGRLYDRSRDIHDRYGGLRQSGISSSADNPLVFLFAATRGKEYGYEDGWSDDGVYSTTPARDRWET